MPSVSERLNDSGQTMHHLRRVGPPATKVGVVDIMDFRKVTSIIGRNGNVVDFYLDSSDNVQCHLLSRQHARVVRLQDNQHKLFDDSLNGVFVNHVKISGAVILSEGDLVTFGHMMGNKLAVGIRVRQPDSEYQFIFERCNCPEPVEEMNTKKKFAVPKSPRSAKKKRERNATRTVTPEELQNVKVKTSLLQAVEPCSSSDVVVPQASTSPTVQSGGSQSTEVTDTRIPATTTSTDVTVPISSSQTSILQSDTSQSAKVPENYVSTDKAAKNSAPSTLQSTISQNTEGPETAVSADLTVPQSASAAETSTSQSTSSQSTKVPEASISIDVTVPHFSETSVSQSATSQSTKMPEPTVCQSSTATSELSVTETSDTNSRFENSESLVNESLSAKTLLSSAKPEIHVSTDTSNDREGSENRTELLTKIESNSPQIAVPMNIDILETPSNDDSLPSESEQIPSEQSVFEQIPSDQMENRRQTLISSVNTSESACGQSSCLETEGDNNVIDHRNTTVLSTNDGVRVPSDAQHAEVGNGSVTDSHNMDEQNIISYNGQFVSFDIKDQVTNRSCTEGSEKEQQDEQLKIAERETNTGNEEFLHEAENVETGDVQVEMECSGLSIDRISEKMEEEDGSVNDVQLVYDGARSTLNEEFSMSNKVDSESKLRSSDVSNACTIISDGTVESSNNQEVVTKPGEPQQGSLNRSVLSTVSEVRGEEQLHGCSDREAGSSGQEMDTDDDELLLAYNASEIEMEAESEGSHHIILQNTCSTGKQTEISMVSKSANGLAEKFVQSASVDVDTHDAHEMEVVDVSENVQQNSPAADKTELELDNQANNKEQLVNQSPENMLEDGAVTSQTEKLEDNPLELSKGVEEGLESRLNEGEERGPIVGEEVVLEATNKNQTVCVNQEQVDEVNNAGYQLESSISVSMECKSDKSYCEQTDTANQTTSTTMSSSIISGSSNVNHSTAAQDTTKMFDSSHLEVVDVHNSSAVNETRTFDSKELDSSTLSGELISDKSAENQNCLEKTMDNLSSSIDMDKFEKSHELNAFQFADVEINMEEDRNDNFALDKTRCTENVKSSMEEVKSLENSNDLHSTHLIEGDTIVTMEEDAGPKFEDGESVISKDIEISGNVMDGNAETTQKVKLDETPSMEELKLDETPSGEEKGDNVEVLYKTTRSTFMLSDSVDFGLKDDVIDDEENLSEDEVDNVETNLPTKELETAAVISDTKQKEEVPNSLAKNEIDVIDSKQEENAKLSENEIVVMDTKQQEEESLEKEIVVIEIDEQDEDTHSLENEVIVIETNGQNDNAKSSETEALVLETKQEETDLSSENEVIVIDSDELEDDVHSLEKEDVVMETKQEATESLPSEVVIETKQEVAESSENEVVVFEEIQKEEAESNSVNENVVMETKQLEDEAKPSSEKVVVVMETSQQEESKIQDVVTPSEDYTHSKEPIDSESETSQNPKIESRSSIIGLSQQYAELEHVMEMNRDVGSCMDSILDRVDSECNNESNGSSETNEDRLTNSNDKLVELPTNTLIEIEVSMESAKNLGLILKGENETSQSPNEGKPSIDQDQFVNVTPQCVISTTEVEKMENCNVEENTETVVEKQFTIEDLVRLESKMQSDSENEQSIRIVATEQPKVPQDGEKSTKDETICEAVQEDLSDSEDTYKSKCEIKNDASDQLKSEKSNSQPQKSEKIDSQPEEFEVYIDNHDAKEASNRDILETMKILNSPVFVDEETGAMAKEEQLKHTKIEEAESTNVMEVADIGASNVESTTVEEVADSGALNDGSTTVEEVADIGVFNDEGTSVEEVTDIGVSNEVPIPSPEERENVVTVMLSDNDDEDEAVDEIELLELQTQKTDSDDQNDEQQTDPDLVQDFSNAIPLYNNSNHEDNSAHVTDSEALEQCNVKKLEHNTSQNADQEVNGLESKDCNQMVTGNGVPDLCSPNRLSNPNAVCSNNMHQPVKEQCVSSPVNSVHVQGISETSETKTSSKYVEIKGSLSSESDDIDKISPTNDLVYEWTVDPCKVPDSIESSYSLNTMGSSIDSMFRNSVEPSADVEEEDVDMLVTSSQVLYGGGEAVSIDGSSALGEMEGSSETEVESFTSIKEAKFKYVSNVDLERETSVGQKSSVSTAIEDGQKLDMHVDDSDKGFYAENVNGQVSSFYRGSEGEPKYPANGTKRKLCDDDESNSSAKKPCSEKEERMTRMCTRLSKIVKQYFSIRHFYSREKHRSPAQVKKDLISGLVRNFFKNTQSDFTSRSDKDLVNPKTRQLNLSEDDDVYRQKQDENVGKKKSSLDKTMNDILKSSSEQRSNIDINLNHIHPDSTTMNMDIESKHKTQGKSLKEMAENSSDTSSSNSIQSLHSESLEILDTNYREFRDTVDDSLEITKSGSFRENDRTNLQIIKERDLFVSSRQQEKDESLECNDVNKKCDSDKMKSINKDKDGHQVDPDSSSRTTSKEDGKCGLAGMLSQLQFDSLVQSISRDSQPMVLKEGNVTVVIGIPSASVSHSMINTDEKSFCDAETQASSVDIDMETGVIDPRSISLPSSLETVYSEETASFIKADIIYMDKGYVDLNINQNAQHSSSNRSSQISMEGESHSMECTHDSIETQMHSEETLYKISSTEGNCLSDFVRDSSERDGENLNHGLKKTTNALNMEDNSHNEQTGNASCLSDRRPSSECSHDSCGSNQSMSVLGNIILSYSDSVEDKSRATLPTSKGNESLDLVTTKETKENLNTTKNNEEERTVHPGSSSLQDSLQEERDSFGPPIPDSSNDFVQGMSDDDFNGEKETTESSIEIYSMSSSPDDSFEVLPHHSKKPIPRSASQILSSSKKDKERKVISGISEETKDQNNSAGSMESVGEGRQSCSQNKVKTSDMVREDGSLQSVCTNLKTKRRSRRWSSDSTNPDADDAAGISDSTVHSVNADEKTEDDQTDCKAENGDITLTDEHDDVHTDLNSPSYLNSPNSRSHSRCSLTKNYHYGPGDKTISVSSDEALSDDNNGGSSAITKPLKRSNSSELSFDFSQRASQMISKLPEFEEFEDLQTCDIKQETFRRFSDFEDIVISDSSDSDLPEVEFLKYESPKKNLVQQIKNEMLTPKCKTEICDPDLEGQRKTEKKSEPSVSKEAPSSTRKRKKRKSPGKEAEAVKDKKKAQSPRYSEVSKKKKRVKSPKRKMKYMDSDSDVVIISGDRESDTYEVTQSKRCTPVKKEIIYSDDDEFQPMRASQNLPKGKGKQRNAPTPKASPDVEAKSGGKKQKLKRRKKRTSGRNTCKDGERPDRQKPSDNSDSEDDLNMLYFHDVKEGSAKGGYSLEDIFNSESRQSLQGKDGCDDGNNEKDEDDNGMKDDNVDYENQMKDDISEEFSNQNECEEDLVSETQLDNRDQAESGLELPALDVTAAKSPSASQAMSPVIPSFVKVTHSLEDESMNELPDPKTRPMKDDDADSESAMDSHEEDVSQKDAKNGIDNTECYQSSGEIPKVYIDRAESIDRSPRTVNAGVPGRNEGQKGEEKCANSATCAMEVIKDRVKEDKVTEDKDAEDQVTASFDDEDDFVSPVIDFTALKSDDESGLDNPANDEILRKGTSKRARDSDSDNDIDVDDYAGHESPSTAGVKATNVDTPKGARDSINSDDDFEPIPSTSFKKRKMFEESESPAKKPCREVVTLDEEMSTQAVQDISNTQFEAATEQLTEGQGQSPTKKSRARMLIERLKAKRLKGQKEKSPEREPSSGLSQETPDDLPNAGMSRRQILRTDVQKDNAEEHIRRSRDILQKLRTAFSSSSKLTTNPRVVQWKKDLTELEDKAVLPKTIIAVVGDTGAGKSSLMNALLDQLDVLPTSGMRACTAVVVEVMENTTNNKFEADITFLSREEWYKELRLLLKDLTDSEGKIKKGTPDPKSEAGVAFLKIKAVYGRIDTFDVLSRIGLVTRWLDKTRTISSTNPESFRNAINCYIETDDPGAGGQYWPIVKQVRIRLPNCDVCSSGAVLVDLPGVRDSNAARDKIARDYLKKCTVVWVVSSIHRAIDDKTAKDLLGENFRRQLLMDGQYGSIAFICTKADIIKPTEIIRGLKLQKDIQCYEKNLEELTVEQSNLEENINDNKTCLRSMRKEGKQLKKELEELQEVMAEGDVMDLESQEFIELQEEKEKKDQAVKENQENIEKYEKETNEAEKRCLQINIDKSKIRKQLSAFCAMKRNEYSKLQIKKDFKAGLREMKRRADMNTTDFDEEDDDDLYNSDEDDEEIGSSADNLKVFCVSAVEYQKMKNLLTNDGPPAVFSSEDETQIPALQQYVHQLTSVRRKHGVERLLQRLAQYVFDINHYLVEDGTESKSARLHMKNAIKLHSNGLMEKFDPVMQKLMSDLNEAFCGQINPKMYEGVAAANGAANNIVAKWGSKQNKENKSEGGLHLSTYRATIRRQGVFTSPSFGPVNFNEDLSAPMYTCLSIVWDKVFSGILWNHLERCKIILIHTLKSFVDGLCKELLALGVSDTRTSRVTQQIIDSSTHKLSEMISFLKEYVTEQQREINRVLTPTVQENLSRTYENCTMESGKGMFMRIKEKMSQGVDCSRFIMFDEASKRLITDLEELQKHIISYVRRVCEEICGMLQTSFEPLYEAPENTKLLRKTLLKDIEASSSSMRSLLTEANINLPALALPAATTDTKATAASASSTSGPLAVPSKGPQAYTTTYKGVQHVVTDTLGFPQNITSEEVKSTYVTDILRSIKEEPGVTSSTIPVSAVHIKKEWNSTDCGQGSVRETIESMDYNQGQYAPLPSSCSSVSKKPFVSDQHCKTSSSNIPLGQSMVSILPNTANLAQSSNSYTSILQPHVTTQPRVTNPSVSRKTGESVIQLTQGSNSVVVPSAPQIIVNQTNSASTVSDHGAAQYGHPVFMDVPSVAQTVEVTSSNSGPALSAATGLPGLSSSQSRDNSVLRKKIVQNAKNLKVPHSLRSPEKSATSHSSTTTSSSRLSPKGSDSPSLKFYKSGRLSLSQKRSGSPVQNSSNVTVKFGNSYEPASKIQRTEKGKVIKITENKPSPKTAAKKKSAKESGGLELEFIVQCRYCGYSSRNLKECDRCGRVFPRNVKVSAIKKK